MRVEKEKVKNEKSQKEIKKESETKKALKQPQKDEEARIKRVNNMAKGVSTSSTYASGSTLPMLPMPTPTH